MSVSSLVLVLLTGLIYKVCSQGQSGNGNRTELDDNGAKSIRILALVPWPDNREHAGWDAGPDLLAAGRVAVKEINSRLDLLPEYKLEMIEAGHEACGLTDVNIGVLNLAANAINPPNHTVAVVVGLYCSTSAKVIAPIAGISDLIQLSAANSPLFRTNSNSFPHLWRFLVSASVYADMMIALMERYGWNKVGVVQDLETVFHSEIAESFLHQVHKDPSKSVLYQAGLVMTKTTLITSALNNLKQTGSRIIFVSATGPQTAKLLCSAADLYMYYPDYMWIITDFLLSSLEYEAESIEGCNSTKIRRALNGSLIGYFNIGPKNDSVVFVNASNETYGEYKAKYAVELENIRADFQETNIEGDALYAGILYDQVWAFALSLQIALPELRRNNISIEEYKYGQPTTTGILENALSQVSFQGVTGHIKFSKDHEVSTPIDIYQVHNGTEVLIGVFNISNSNVYSLDINMNHVVDDDIEVIIIYLPQGATIFLYCATAIVALILTIILISFIYRRNDPRIKATSPYFTLFMFFGCYCLCAVCVVRITYSSFNLSHLDFNVLCNMQTFLVYNGLSFVFVTLFIKLLRIHKIFNNKKLKYLGWRWSTCFLSIVVFVMTLIPNIIAVLWVTIDPQRRTVQTEYVHNTPLLQKCEQYVCTSPLLGVWHSMMTLYLSFLLIMVVYLAARTRRIPHNNFKDTKKVNIFIFIFVLTFIISAVFLWIFIAIEAAIVGQTVIVIGELLMVSECQFILFLPKVIGPVKRQYSIKAGLKQALYVI